MELALVVISRATLASGSERVGASVLCSVYMDLAMGLAEMREVAARRMARDGSFILNVGYNWIERLEEAR